MKINDFKLERYFAQHEFTAKYLLSSSDCDGFALQEVLSVANPEELKLWENLKLGYTESKGHPLLREAILKHYSIKTIDNVVVASPGELNFVAMNVLLEPGDHAIVVSPAYQSLHEVIRSLHCELSFWKPNPENWEFNTADLEQLIRPNTKLIVINFPHNPTGSYLSRAQLKSIVAIAKKQDCYIFSDEMYHQLVVGDMPLLPPISDLYEKGISLWGTSKSFGMAGLRIGWLVTHDSGFLDRVVAFKDFLSICSSAPSEILALIALNHSDLFLLPNLQKIKENIALFRQFALNQPIIASFNVPRAGSTAFVRLNIPIPALEFSNRLVEKTGIMTVPAEMFDCTQSYIRVGFGRANFPEVLETLGMALKTFDFK